MTFPSRTSKALLVLLFCLVTFVPATAQDTERGAPVSAGARMPGHYLLLVNTAIAFQMTDAKFRQFNQSPYDGIAVAFQHAYDTTAVPSSASMESQVKVWRASTQKDIWPWVYVNRMIGRNAQENNDHADTPYFNSIAGADLDDTRGAQSDFLAMWKNALDAARDTHVPGVVFDSEFYNNYREYDIGELARRTGKSPAEAAASLSKIGARMADIAQTEYPDAVLWFFFTALTHAGYKAYAGKPYYPSPAYIALGLLDEIKRKNMRLKVLAGGEGSLGYCHDTLGDFGVAIAKRQADMIDSLQQYSGILELAGTMTLWRDVASNNVCKTASAPSIEELSHT
jgi:hypothetical protein